MTSDTDTDTGSALVPSVLPATDTGSGSALATTGTAAQLGAASITPATLRAYSGALRRLAEHLGGAKLSDATLAAYLGVLFERGRAPATAAMAVAAVRFQARFTDTASPVGPATDRVLAGFRRAARDRGRGQVAGVRWSQADAAAAVAANGGESIHGLRDAAILAVASDAMLRVSELAALRVGDIGAGEDNAATVTVRHSKTDQEGEGAVLFLGPSTAARISAWLDAAGVSTDDTDAPLSGRGGSGSHLHRKRPARPAPMLYGLPPAFVAPEASPSRGRWRSWSRATHTRFFEWRERWRSTTRRSLAWRT